MMGDGLHQTVGERGIGVQVRGDGNTTIVYAGAAELVLTRKHTRRAKPATELQLLRVDLRATTLVGREDELTALQAWLASDRPVSVRCITGRAGVGKTRLAVELCERAERDGWTAGFALYSQFPKFVEGSAGWRWVKPTLVVIDYAAALASPLRTWLEILALPETQAGGKKLRVLLLERHAERDLGWWADLLRPASFSDAGPDELADPPEPARLSSLSDVEDRRALLAEAMRWAGQIAERQPIPEPPPRVTNAAFDRRLKDDAINNEPLYLMMAGAEAIQTGATAALALSRVDLAERAASRERARLGHLAAQWGLPEKLVAHVALCVTLQGGSGAQDALTLVAEERHVRGFPETVPAEDIVNHLAEALPSPGGMGIDAIRPDLIGEAFLLQGMREHHRFPARQTEIVERAWQRAGGKVAATLIRTAQDFAGGDAKHSTVGWLVHLIDRTQDRTALGSLVAELPKQTLALRELAAYAQGRLAGMLSEQVRAEPESLSRRAGALNDLANRLSALGRREAALAAAEEAAALYRELAAQWPDAFRPDLARSLNNLAIVLSALGRRGAALAAAEEAATLYRELAAQRPDAFRPYLAGSLTNLANRLSDLDRCEAALEAAEQAAALYRQLAAQRPDAFRPDLACSLTNLANRLSNLDRREAALEAAEEAVALYRELAAQRPDAFRPDLALSLHNLAIVLSNLGRREAALAAAEQAVAIRRELAAQQPDAFQPYLATSLAIQANCFDPLDRLEDVLTSSAEAVANLAPAFVQHAAAFSHWMRPMLQQYLQRCKDFGRMPDAALVEPILAILRKQGAQEGRSQDEH